MSKVIWSDRARKDLIEIKAFYDERNESDAYSKRLLRTFRNVTHLIKKYSNVGRLTDDRNVRGFIILNFIIFYEKLDEHILILTVWDCRKDPEQLNEILKD